MNDRTNRDERETDPNDFADARYLMDDGEVLVVCPVCKREHCVCDYYGEAPEKFRSYGHRRRG